MFSEIPTTKPNTPLLDRINNPEALRQLDPSHLEELARQLRAYLIYLVGQTGGHFGAGLGVIELTIALHYVFNTPSDQLVWDVGHQTYPHKILTERREKMHTLRQKDGIAAFPKRTESIYDSFGVGHSSTSISAALGMAIAYEQQQKQNRAIAIIGDGALTAGMAYEAINHAADLKANLLIVLNDNDMSISHNVGGMANYLTKILSSKTYHDFKSSSKKILQHLPSAFELAQRTEAHLKGMVTPGTLFEELGLNYIGPIDGHNIKSLINTLNGIKQLNGPQFLHVITTKGKGFISAEEDPVKYHAINKMPPQTKTQKTINEKIILNNHIAKPTLKYSNIFGQWLYDMATVDNKLQGITPAMCEGSDLIRFAERFPARYFDVAIAEQHALTLAAGMACEQLKPVVAIYSTFLQRAYDQLIHDIALQKLDVLLAIDRAGLVGEDGPTHHGVFDLAFLRCIPNLIIMTPSDENELRQLLSTGYIYSGPAAVRYPRGCVQGVKTTKSLEPLPIGKAHLIKNGSNIVFLSFGTILEQALPVATKWNATLIDMRFVKPIDESLLLEVAKTHHLIVTLEEGCINGGAGSACSEILNQHLITTPIIHIGIQDEFIESASCKEQFESCHLTTEYIEQKVQSVWMRLQNRNIHSHRKKITQFSWQVEKNN